MTSDAKATLTPKLRFPAFRNAGTWTIEPLAKICDVLNNRRRPISSDQRAPGPYPYYGASGIVDYVGEFIFDERLLLVGEDGAKWEAFEKTAFIAEGKYWVNNHAHVLKPTGVNDALLENYLTMADLGPFVTGAAPPKLTLGKLRSIPIPIPESLAEQQKIAECLSTLDELIVATSQKLDALKAHKKGLMQQLFPREGETLPRLRFPEFESAAAWTLTRLSGEIALISGLHLAPDEYSSVGDVPYFTGPSDFTNELRSVTKWTSRSANVAQPEDTLINVKGSGVGEVWYSTLPAVVIGRQLMAVRAKSGVSQFVYQFLLTKKTRFEDLGAGNLIPGLSRTDILEMEVYFPSPTEQQRIASCLSALDDLIAAQNAKLEALKTHKKGLMQQLFPSPAEAVI